MDNAVIGRIKVNKNTKGHTKILEEYGYSFEADDEKIIVQAPGGFVDSDEAIDVSDEEKFLDFFEDVIKNKKMVPYAQRFLFEDGKSLSAPFNLSRLGDFSAFVAKPLKKGESASSGPKLSALKSRLKGDSGEE